MHDLRRCPGIVRRPQHAGQAPPPCGPTFFHDHLLIRRQVVDHHRQAVLPGTQQRDSAFCRPRGPSGHLDAEAVCASGRSTTGPEEPNSSAPSAQARPSTSDALNRRTCWTIADGIAKAPPRDAGPERPGSQPASEAGKAVKPGCRGPALGCRTTNAAFRMRPASDRTTSMPMPRPASSVSSRAVGKPGANHELGQFLLGHGPALIEQFNSIARCRIRCRSQSAGHRSAKHDDDLVAFPA